MKKKGIMIGIFFLALLLPLISAGFLDKIFGKDVRESPQDFSVRVGNTPPTVTVQSIINPIIPAGSTGPVNIIFRASDNNGITTLVDSSIFIALNYSGGGESRAGTNANCIPTDIDSITREYNCNITLFYYDHSGIWGINASIRDTGDLQGKDDDNTTVVPELRAISFPAGTIGFGSVTPGQTNIASLLPTGLTNNGNYGLDGVANSLYVESTSLIGQTNGAYNIPANNFKAAGASVSDVCSVGGTNLVGTPTQTPIPSVVLPKGSLGTSFPTENVSYCLTLVPSGLLDQIYSTTASGGVAWQITI